MKKSLEVAIAEELVWRMQNGHERDDIVAVQPQLIHNLIRNDCGEGKPKEEPMISER